MLIVQLCDFGVDGDAYYRLHAPTRQLGQLPGVTAVDCHFYHRFVQSLSEQADVLVVQFVNDWDILSLVARRRAAGLVTLFEANDYFFDLQPWNPIASRWHDRTVQELYLQLLTTCDGVQTSTNELARRWRERGARQVAVFANQFEEVRPLPEVPPRPLTVGWAGSPGHFADWYYLAPHLSRWLNAHPDVHVAVMTHELARPFLQLPPERYRFKSFGSLPDYLDFLRGLDIGLVPLLPTGYNRGRSDVKFLEYASQGLPGVYADLEPYRDTVVPAETGLLADSPEAMIAGLDRLYNDPTLRQKIRRQAHEYLSRQRLLQDHIHERSAWYRSLMTRPPQAGPLADAVRNTARSEGNYLQLLAEEPERTLIDAIQKPTPAHATSRLAAVLERHAHYLVALQCQGQLLNDRREHRAALTYLERARELAPYSARTWSEIGRAWYRLNDDGRARVALEEAIRLTPKYLPGWQYLLRLLTLTKSPDSPSFAERAKAQFPSCYPIALQGAQARPPAQAVVELLRVLERFAPELTAAEKPLAAAAFRQAIVAVIQEGNLGENLLTLLRRASAVFPESARLASELGNALYRSGQIDEAIAHQARALALRLQAQLYQEEYPKDDGSQWTWQLADHIQRVLGRNEAGGMSDDKLTGRWTSDGKANLE